MLFNSFNFLYFILVLLPVFYITPQKYRKFILLVASYYFYMCWHYSYVVLILFSTVTSYWAGIKIENCYNRKHQKLYLIISICASLSLLIYFKYYNFFIVNVNSLAGTNFNLLNYLLPVGISFYTFETLSYTVDVYQRKIRAEKNFGVYALFISFFPKLVAGPIERAEALLPQFYLCNKLNIAYFIQGAKFVIIGFFMKLVVADRLGLYVDSVYNNVHLHSGYSFIVATLLFSFQIYGDFAGYSFIAKGIAKCFGYNLTLNFRQPYLATGFSDFWRRWHISLSKWFTDYIFIPLGGGRVVKSRFYLNLFITLLISGLWHGANWTFITWGAMHGILLVAKNIFAPKVKSPAVKQTWFLKLSKIAFVFAIVSLSWIFFRANSMADAWYIIVNIANLQNSIFIDFPTFFYGIIGICTLVLIDNYVEKKRVDNLLHNEKINLPVILVFSILTLMILYIGVFNGGQFIYFQF